MESRFPEESSLIDARYLLINLALLAKLNVDKVSWQNIVEGLIFAIKFVLELPPRESFRRNVNFELRQFTCCILPSETQESELMTEAKFIRDLLILHPYLSLSPVLILVLSEPAKSIKLKDLLLVFITPFFVYFDSIFIVKTE